MKKTTKKIAALALSSTMLLSGLAATPIANNVFDIPSIVASAADSTWEDVENHVKYTYFISNNQVTIRTIEIKSNASDTLTIPSKINGKTVAILMENAIQASNAGKIKTLILPYSLKSVGTSALQKLTNLTTLQISEALKQFKGAHGTPPVENLSFVRSNGTSYAVTASVIDSIASNATVQKDHDNYFKVIDNAGPVGLLDVLARSPFADTVCREKAQQIVQEVTTPGMSQRQKADALYNYMLTHTRYSKLIESSTNELCNSHQKAFGSLFFHSGVCAGFSYAMEYLGDAANLDIKVTGGGGHAWNLFKPSDKTEYYHIDLTNRMFCTGITEGGTATATDGSECVLADDFLGNTIMVYVKNKSGQNFTIRLRNRNTQNKVYFDFRMQNYNDAGTLYLSQLPVTNDITLYAYDNSYYQAEILDDNGNILKTVDYVLNNTGTTYNFTDADNNQHRLVTSLNTDPTNENNERTVYHAHYVLEIF